ncbi:MAG: FtsW/RodA/SpoVE family cell cycle protein [Terricaulis sp.]|nr:FtsW/RodA/SpoVE family cell cycle protein [Terricaulis sp.]
MKIAIVLALARYYHQLDPRKSGTVLWAIPAFLMIAVPVGLVMHQPDLGTSLMILFAGICVMFLGGLLWRIIAAGALVAVGGAIFAYSSILHEYQRDRVNVFLGITDDPLGASAITSCNRKSRWARRASSAAAICKARKASSISSPKSTPISSSP